MRTESRKIAKSSWAKLSMKKWLHLKSFADKSHTDFNELGTHRERRKSCSGLKECYVVVPEAFSEGWLLEAEDGGKQYSVLEKQAPVVIGKKLNLRMFVGTWNVGGKSPYNEGLNLRDWLSLDSPSPADIYVIGFQEIVPLNAGNVLGPEDCGPASKWLTLIGEALNSNNEFDSDLKPSSSFCGILSLDQQPPYCLAASKQMVGIFLCVWVRSHLLQHVTSLKVSCIGRGIMGCLGNKGSISMSMTLHGTTFCFVCTHLASGEKDGDEVRRNLDVSEILKKTKFSSSFKALGHSLSPGSILEHDKIIWLGDLNYRLATGYADTRELLKKNDWPALLEKDQLRTEQRAGRVFQGWKEGNIYFAPTYKYLANSDHYVVRTSKSKEKHRTPAWCDRILWKGEGLKQMWYERGESRFSDHRPVYSLFSVLVDTTAKNHVTAKPNNNAAALSPTCAARVQAEEQLLLLTRVQCCIQSTRRL
ncbi:hypothetical protein K1719_006906 [Acacia pycnantha]|nr:hypothetical protein K1719_006906 [Acacia pycnantha]